MDTEVDPLDVTHLANLSAQVAAVHDAVAERVTGTLNGVARTPFPMSTWDVKGLGQAVNLLDALARRTRA